MEASKKLLLDFNDTIFSRGCTATNVGFYGPQGRTLRLKVKDENLNTSLACFEYQGVKITNLEMENNINTFFRLSNSIIIERLRDNFPELPSIHY